MLLEGTSTGYTNYVKLFANFFTKLIPLLWIFLSLGKLSSLISIPPAYASILAIVVYSSIDYSLYYFSIYYNSNSYIIYFLFYSSVNPVCFY